MGKIKSPSELESFRKSILDKRDSRKKIIRICNTGCRGRGSSKVVEAFEHHIRKKNLHDQVILKKTGCHGFCEIGSVLVIEPDNILYKDVKPENVPDILSETILQGNILKRLLYRDPIGKKRIQREADIPFYRNQEKTVSHNTGKIDPTDLDDYIAAGGYEALSKVLSSMTPVQVIETIEGSQLRGRGGGGF